MLLLHLIIHQDPYYVETVSPMYILIFAVFPLLFTSISITVGGKEPAKYNNGKFIWNRLLKVSELTNSPSDY
jgi:hypothetical protein